MTNLPGEMNVHNWHLEQPTRCAFVKPRLSRTQTDTSAATNMTSASTPASGFCFLPVDRMPSVPKSHSACSTIPTIRVPVVIRVTYRAVPATKANTNWAAVVLTDCPKSAFIAWSSENSTELISQTATFAAPTFAESHDQQTAADEFLGESDQQAADQDQRQQCRVRRMDIDRRDVDHRHDGEERRNDQRPPRSGPRVPEQRGIPPPEQVVAIASNDAPSPIGRTMPRSTCARVSASAVVAGSGDPPDHPDQDHVGDEHRDGDVSGVPGHRHICMPLVVPVESTGRCAEPGAAPLCAGSGVRIASRSPREEYSTMGGSAQISRVCRG